ncbi:hypothetical protein J3458_012334 [Metarhizium acridum]|uniref:uncharacterized protein n=1 Tax=Metarhizium acridum TaxID=92637 RepID=UPI001C6BFB6E|nr:hypothetical protein J3458_012334 [Metarhizium acridum]
MGEIAQGWGKGPQRLVCAALLHCRTKKTRSNQEDQGPRHPQHQAHQVTTISNKRGLVWDSRQAMETQAAGVCGGGQQADKEIDERALEVKAQNGTCYPDNMG